tara:strand:- start:31 stop:1119 length:1089 start_codon:yes stop_codon:yes gene_type:complete
MNKVLNNYLIFGFLKIVLNVVLVFICLGILLNLFEEIEFFKNLDVGYNLPFLMTAMFIPNLLIKFLPFVIFIAAMWYFVSIKSSKDLLTLKVFGFSNLKIILILGLTAFAFGVLVIFALNPITSAMIKFYEQTKAKYSKDVDHLVSINKNGLWIKENIGDNLRIITAKKLVKNNLNDITIYEIDHNNKILKRIESSYANIKKNEWMLENTKIYNFGEEEVVIANEGNYVINSVYNIDKIGSLYKNLDTISFFELIKDYEVLKDKGYSKTILNEKLNEFFSLPFFLFLMVILASIFSVGSITKSQNLYYIFISIISCVVIYFLSQASLALGQTQRISLELAVWIPILAIGLFCSIGVLQINEK